LDTLRILLVASSRLALILGALLLAALFNSAAAAIQQIAPRSVSPVLEFLVPWVVGAVDVSLVSIVVVYVAADAVDEAFKVIRRQSR